MNEVREEKIEQETNKETQFVNEFGINNEGRNTSTDKTKEIILQLYNKGYDMNTIAEITNMNVEEIKKIFYKPI